MKYLILLAIVLMCAGCGFRAYHEKANVLYATVEVEGTDALPETYRAPVQEWYEARKATPFAKAGKVVRLIDALKSAENSKERLAIIRAALADLKD